jgi:hypothetical protein
MDSVDEDMNKLMLFFMSENRTWALGKSMDRYCDRTFNSFWLLLASSISSWVSWVCLKRAVLCFSALLPYKQGKAYQHMWKVMKSLVKFKE